MCNQMANELVGSLIMPCTPSRDEKSTSGDGSSSIMVDMAVPINIMECKIVDASKMVREMSQVKALIGSDVH